ncbi:MAG: PucR family transcriptional regulator [Ruminococcaceae bacterium]|nr:PucR family transcriptional regulator [Oscillospiraceae bacterium]
MANKLFQGFVYQMRDAVKRTIGVLDETGTVIACSQLSEIGKSYKSVADEISYSFDVVVYDGYAFKPMGSHARIEYIVFAEGEDDEAKNLVSMLLVSLTNLKALYDEKHDKAHFVKNAIFDNILPGDIYTKSRELHFDSEAERIVYVIMFEQSYDIIPFDVIQNIVADRDRDYVINASENEVLLVKELRTAADHKNIDNIAKTIVDTALGEFYLKAVVGIGTVATNVRELARSYKDAKMAIGVGSVFEPKKNIVKYGSLGIGRLLYHLPVTLCEMFLHEVFKRNSLETLDRETLLTIQAFFENNLNVSETSRKLFVHRNTLVYRLEKIKKLTGLDLREFEDAIIFKVALMVEKYVDYKHMGTQNNTDVSQK